MNRQSSITLIAAMSRNRVIGKGGALPWRMPADLQRFKRRTIGHAVIMGRRTWDAMNRRPLPGRTNIIVTRDRGFAAESGELVAHALDEALLIARRERPDAKAVFIAGGAQIYREAMPLADVIDLTLIETDIEDGDAFFPAFESARSWRLVEDEAHPADDRHPYAYRFQRWERAPGANGATGVR